MNPKQLREFAAAFQESRILLTGFELDLFTHIGEAGASALQLSAQLGLDQHACTRLLNALVSLGFLTKSDEHFFNTEESLTFLSKKSPEYLGGLMHTNHLWNSWSQLTTVVKSGKSAHPTEINERGTDWLLSFIQAMHDRAIRQAPVQLAGIDLTGVHKLLDVGGGSGAYSMEFIRREPTILATVFDLSNVIGITEGFIKREGFLGSINCITGDYTKDPLPCGYDLVFLSAIIHSNSLIENTQLIKKCFNAVGPGGRIIIQDWVMNNDRTEPLSGAIFAINMLVGTESGDCFTEEEVVGMLKSAGFEQVVRKEFDSGLSQVTALKPK